MALGKVVVLPSGQKFNSKHPAAWRLSCANLAPANQARAVSSLVGLEAALHHACTIYNKDPPALHGALSHYLEAWDKAARSDCARRVLCLPYVLPIGDH